jgi:hypothetical protein
MIIPDRLKSLATDPLTENKRLQLLLYATGVLVILYLVLVVHDYRVELESEVFARARVYHKLVAVTGQAGWQDYARQAQSAREDATARLWPATSEGVAKASIQGWVEELLARNGIVPRFIKADAITDSALDGRLIKVMVSLGGEFNSHSFYALLRDLEQAERLAVVEFMDLSSGRRNTFTLTISGWGIDDTGGKQE